MRCTGVGKPKCPDTERESNNAVVHFVLVLNPRVSHAITDLVPLHLLLQFSLEWSGCWMDTSEQTAVGQVLRPGIVTEQEAGHSMFDQQVVCRRCLVVS